jgi:hypothetical protein
MRSDWTASADGDDEIDHEYLSPTKSMQRANSIGILNEEALRKKAEIDERVAHYVSDQLERVRSGAESSANDDELETQLDGAGDYFSNGIGYTNGAHDEL